jgi:hypothetical protein
VANGQSGKEATNPISSRPSTAASTKPISSAKPYKAPPTTKIVPANDVIRIGYPKSEKKPNETQKSLLESSSLGSTSVIEPSEVSEELPKAIIPKESESHDSGKTKKSGPGEVDSGRLSVLDSDNFESDAPNSVKSEHAASIAHKPSTGSIEEMPLDDTKPEVLGDSDHFDEFENSGTVEVPVESLAQSLVSGVRDIDESQPEVEAHEPELSVSDAEPHDAANDGLDDDSDQFF